MRSSRIVDDAVRRWIELQRDLGGDEVILDQALPATPRGRQTAEPPTPARIAVASRAPVPALPGLEVALPGPEPRPMRIVLTGDPDAAWRKGMPAVPGPGLSVWSPGPAGDLPEWDTLSAVATVIASCVRCPLCRSRTLTVPGEGDPSARLFCVGEGPGESEDVSGRPFVGRAGELLDKILENIEVPRRTAHIANVVKCRPPKNRAPLPDEREACMPYLRRQIALVRPKVLLALGSTAAEALLGVKKPLGELRLKVHRYDGIPLIVTYHPAALLRNPNWKRPAWDDVRIARQLLDAS